MVAIYKDLSDVEQGFRQLKDVLAMRPIYHQIEPRVKAHIFVAAWRCWCSGSWIAGSRRRGSTSRRSGRWKRYNGTSGDVSPGRSTGAARGQRRLSGCAAGPEGLKLTELRPPDPPRGKKP